jgi:hypothetical protein
MNSPSHMIRGVVKHRPKFADEAGTGEENHGTAIRDEASEAGRVTKLREIHGFH